MAKKNKSRKSQPPTHRPPVTEELRDMAFSHAFRDQQLFEQVKDSINPSCFGPHEGWLFLIWSIVCEHYDETGALPNSLTMLARLNSALELSPDCIQDGQEETMNNFIHAVFNEVELESMQRPYSLRMIQEFLEDRLMHDYRDKFSVPQTPADMTAFTGELLERSVNLKLLGKASNLAQPFAAGWDAPGVMPVPVPTNISFIDATAGGGVCVGETYGLMGPFGGGKTTVGVMLGVEAAQAAYQDWEAAGGTDDNDIPADRAYHFTYEEPQSSLRIRSLSYLGQIPRDRLLPMINQQDYSGLRGPGDGREPYENALFQNAISTGQPIFCERARLSRAIRILNKCWRIIDMTGSDPENPNRGCGLVDEIALIIKRDLQLNSGSSCRTVMADYVGAAVERYIGSNDGDHGELRHNIRSWPFDMRNKIGIPMNCPVWSLHQMSTDANSFEPGRQLQMTDSSEGRAFAEHLDFLFAIGKTNRDNQAMWWPLKNRRIDKPQPIVTQLDGNLARFIGRHDYVLDVHSRTIVSLASRSALTGGAAITRRDSEAPSTRPARAAAGPVVPAGPSIDTSSVEPRRGRRVVRRNNNAASDITTQHSIINNGNQVRRPAFGS